MNFHFVLCQFPLVQFLLLFGVLLRSVPLLPQLVDLLVSVSQGLLQAGECALAGVGLGLYLANIISRDRRQLSNTKYRFGIISVFVFLSGKIFSKVSPVVVETWQCQLDYPSLSADPPDSQSRILKIAKIVKFCNKIEF